MARPKATELTERELAVMQVFWKQGEATAEQAREALTENGENVAYVTVANVVRGLADKGVLKQVNSKRPFRYQAIRSFEDVTKRLLGDMVQKLFAGSREALLVHLLDRKKLTQAEREFLQDILDHQEGDE